MATIESLQKRIKATQDLRDIVSTMKALSSVSILQYDQSAVSLLAYQKNIRDAFHALIRRGAISHFLHKKPPASPKTLAIVIGSDNGLVGRFNKEIMQVVLDYLKEENIPQKETSLITIGKRVAVLAEQTGIHLKAKYAISNSVKVVGSIAGTVIIKMEEALRVDHISRVVLFYHKRETGKPTYIEKITLVPFSEKIFKSLQAKPWPTNNVPQFTIPVEQLLQSLINEYLMIVLSAALTFSLSAEHHARMVNMQNAQKNIDESLEAMNLEFQQKRQDAITEELIDVVSGSEALHAKPKTQKHLHKS